MAENDYIDFSLNLADCSRNNVVEFLHEKMSLWIRSRCSEVELRMPPVSILAQKLGIARQTLSKVYEKLEAEFLIYRQEGTNVWHTLSRRRVRAKCIGIMLPMPFTQYYTKTIDWGMRNFDIYSGIISRATEQDFSTRPLNLPSTDASDHDIELAINNIAAKCDGIIHFGGRGQMKDVPLRKIMERRDIPQITIDCQTNLSHIGVVCFDPQSVAQNVCRYLYPQGHRHICLVYPDYKPRECGLTYNMTNSTEVLSAFEKSRINDEQFSELLTWKTEFGEIFDTKIKEIVEQNSPPSAFWCRSDIIALELINALKRLGYSVPEDFSVIGFDDITAAASMTPPLTTFKNPLFEMGYHSVNNLIKYIENGVKRDSRIMYLPPSLVVRESVCSPRNMKSKHYNSEILMA